MQHGAFVDHLYRYCWSGGESHTSEIPLENPALQFWHLDGSGVRHAVSRHEALRAYVGSGRVTNYVPLKIGGHRWQHVPLSRCKRRCSERGACIAVENSSANQGSSRCRCDPFYSGSACERHASLWCWADCSGRGTCHDGFCRCDMPFYGPGCAFSANGSSSRLVGKASTLRLYVYDLPPLVLRRLVSVSDGQNIFNAHHSFLSNLISEPEPRTFCLTADPGEATLFVLPALGTNIAGGPEYYLHVQRYVAEHYPFWRRKGGADHVLFITSDRGGCHLRNLGVVFDKSIVLAHYLRWQPDDGQVELPDHSTLKLPLTKPLLKVSTGARSNHATTTARSAKRSLGRREPCGSRSRDIAIPPLLPHKTSEWLLNHSQMVIAGRSTRFFFAGKVPEADAIAAGNRSDSRLLAHPYSEGARQMAWKYLRMVQGYKIVQRSSRYAEDFTDSQVCLAALGQGWGIRFLWAVAAGCVPLMPSSPTAYFFSGDLNFSLFSLAHVPTASLNEHFPRRLEGALASGRLQALQDALVIHRRLFLWPPHGLAHHMVLRLLCRRVILSGTAESRSRPGESGMLESTTLASCDALLPGAARFAALLT